MNTTNDHVATICSGGRYSCLIFAKKDLPVLYKTCKAFIFDSKVRYHTNTPKLRARLCTLSHQKKASDSVKGLYKFFLDIPKGAYFAFCSGDIAGSRLFLQITGYLGMRGKTIFIGNLDNKFRLLGYYNFTSLGTLRHKTGKAVRKNRRCRYCGLAIPQTSFNCQAHTISEALGNKTLFTNDECDRCNNRFSYTIEREFIKRLSPSFPALNISGKTNGRKVVGRHFNLSREESRKKPIRVNVSDDAICHSGGVSISDVELRSFSISRSWVPQNIYRFLCKFVIGSLDSRLLRYFQRTIEWINGGEPPGRLPRVCVEYPGQTAFQPTIYIYRRTRNCNHYPYMFARVHLINCAYTFIMPLCSLDLEGLNHESFLKEVTGLIPARRTQWLDLNSCEPISPTITMSFLTGDHLIISDMEAEIPRWHPAK